MFNKDIYGLISSTQVTDDSTGVQAYRFVNRTYASSRGLEISLEKRLTRRLGFEVYYTYSFADGVASDADFGRSAEGLTHLPTEELPLDWDQRHTFNVTLRLADRNKWGATMIYSYGSGLPWTPVDRFARLQDPDPGELAPPGADAQAEPAGAQAVQRVWSRADVVLRRPQSSG